MKKKPSAGWRALFNGITIVIAAVLFVRMYYPDAGKLLDFGRGGNKELSEYLGKPLTVCAEELDVEFHASGNGTYSVRQQTGLNESKRLFTCTVDANGIITRILLRDSGRAGYVLFGLSSDDDAAEGERILSAAGAAPVEDGVWKAPNLADGIFLENTGWACELTSSNLQQSITNAALAAAIEYQFDDSVGFYDLGNGQVLEYCHENLTQLAYEADQGSDLAESEQVKALGGQYVCLSGIIESVDAYGSIWILSTYKPENSWNAKETEYRFFAEAVEEQQSTLSGLSEGSRITLYGRIKSNYNIFQNLYEAVIITVDGKNLDIPQIRSTTSGLHAYTVTDGAATLQPVHKTITYTPYTVDEILTEKEMNEARAEEKYRGQYVELTGKVYGIERDTPRFQLTAMYEEYAGILWFTLENMADIQTVSSWNVGDYVTVRGYFPTSSYSLEVTVHEICAEPSYTAPKETQAPTVEYEEPVSQYPDYEEPAYTGPSYEYDSNGYTAATWIELISGTYQLYDLGLIFELSYDPSIDENTPYFITIYSAYFDPATGDLVRDGGEQSALVDYYGVNGWDATLEFKFPVMDDAYESYMFFYVSTTNRGPAYFVEVHMPYQYESDEFMIPIEKLY